ncbi:MAG: DUF2142 domain-containing protein [Patescibacteria group bacterium]
MNKESIGKLILYFLIPIQLLIFTFLVPPFQKPDEQPHFEKSLLISNGILFCKEKTNNKIKLEKKYVDFIKTPYLDLMTHKNSAKLPLPIFFKDFFSNNQDNNRIDFNIDHLCSFPIISYLPQAFVLWILSFLNVNPIQSIYFVRLAMSILGYFWFLYLYRKIADNYKLIILFTFALPMTLHQISSFSYDALHIMFALTFFMLIINAWIPAFAGMTQTTKKYFKLFFVLFLFLSSKKIGYETFFLFLFLIPIKIKPIIISSLIFIPFYFLSKLSGSYDLQSSLTNQIIHPLQQINFLLSNPLNVLNVIITTTFHRLTFYLQSLIGIFGWLEYGLDPLSYLIYGLFFIYVLSNINIVKKQMLTKNKTILLFITLIGSYIFIVLLAYVFNTAPGTLIANGVQGRYFIPFLPFIILFIIQFKKKPWQNININKVFYYLTVIYLISATFYSVINRYY